MSNAVRRILGFVCPTFTNNKKKLNMYSQNSEDTLIREYFETHLPAKKSFLDVGANDGQTLSNTALFAEIGWSGVCIEPDNRAYENLYRKYAQSKKVKAYNCGIGTQTKQESMFASGSLLNKGDIGLVTTIHGAEMLRFQKSVDYETQLSDFYTWADFCEAYKIKMDFAFVSIDAEGCDLDILLQLDLTKVQVLCIEWNSVVMNKINYVKYCEKFGMRILHQNSENLVFAK